MKRLLVLCLLGICGQALSAPLKPVSELSLDQFRGQVVYLDFWASWCVPCRQSFPWLQSMQDRYGDQGLQIVTINLDSERKDAERFLKELGTDLEVYFDPEGRWAEEYQLPGMPSSFLFDRAGQRVLMHKGFRAADKEPLEKEILRQLNREPSQ